MRAQRKLIYARAHKTVASVTPYHGFSSAFDIHKCVRVRGCMHFCVRACERAASVRAGVGAGVGMSVQRIFVCACAYGQISVRLW